MLRWHHEVDPAWLDARRDVLTATDCVKLRAELKRVKKSGWLDNPVPSKVPVGFAQLWCEKRTEREPDCESFGPAARGHIMEPWAIADWNAQMKTHMFHWDDCIIKLDGLGFSPDAMDVEQEWNDVELFVSADGRTLCGRDGTVIDAPRCILEVKSYDPRAHMKAVLTPRLECDEAFQTAMAFRVLPYLEAAYVLWYCPGAPISMWANKYTRADLHDQICEIDGILGVWDKVCSVMAKSSSKLEASVTEREVFDDWEMQVALDNNSDFFRVR